LPSLNYVWVCSLTAVLLAGGESQSPRGGKITSQKNACGRGAYQPSSAYFVSLRLAIMQQPKQKHLLAHRHCNHDQIQQTQPTNCQMENHFDRHRLDASTLQAKPACIKTELFSHLPPPARKQANGCFTSAGLARQPPEIWIRLRRWKLPVNRQTPPRLCASFVGAH